MSTDLGLMTVAIDAAVAATLTTPGWEDAAVTLATGGAALEVTVFVEVHEQPSGGVQRRGATILVPCSQCPNEPTDGSTIVTFTDTWTARTAVEGARFWRVEAWA